MNLIIYATDCSGHSVQNLKYAYALSRLLGSQLLVLHTYALPPVRVSTIRTNKQLTKLAQEEQLQLVKDYTQKHLGAQQGPNSWVADIVADTSVADGILRKAGELDADLVIAGLTHEQSMRGLLAGNVAHSLLERSHCPVLLIPTTAQYRKPVTLVYATDFEMDDIEAIKQLLPIARAGDAHIIIVHVPVPGEYPGEEQMAWFRELLEQQIDYEKVNFQVLGQGRVKETLAMFVKDKGADLLAMLERKERGFMKTLFHKDLVKEMGRGLEIPVLAFIAG